MAQKDSRGYESYPKDAFDNPPDGPVGVHRGRRSALVRIAPFGVVLVLAVLAGVLFWSIFSGQAANIFRSGRQAEQQTTTQASTTSASSSVQTESPSESATESASASASESPSETASPSQEPEESPTADLADQVVVANGTGVANYAGAKADELRNAGFTDVTATNLADLGLAAPGQTVVWYQSEDQLATAQEVANSLGLDGVAVELNPAIGAPVVAVLMG